jgi:hypothetical protein
MWEIIVLGQVPGTGLRVSFEFWLILIAAVAVIISYVRMRRQVRRLYLLTLLSLTLRLRTPRRVSA